MRGSSSVTVGILDFKEQWHGQPDEEGIEVFSAEMAMAMLGKAVASAARSLLDDIGLDGSKGCWVRHDFPLNELTELEEYLMH